MDTLDQTILDHYQRGIPLSVAPYQDMADALGIDEPTLLSRLQHLLDDGILTRVGPVFNHQMAGASILVALAIPPLQLDDVAAQINRYPGVNHNYVREHRFNLWFVLTAPDHNQLQQTLLDIEQQVRLPMLKLPMEQAYHIDLAFKLAWHN